MRMQLRLVNGWTVSVSDDTPPALCSVAAWPTHYGDAPRDTRLWFNFARVQDGVAGDHACDRRCHDLEDLIEAAEAISAAAPPGVSVEV